MAEILCGYTADRDETLVAYLYGELEPAQRAAFEAHTATCERCRHELEDLQRVRGHLEVWTAPENADPIELPLDGEPSPQRGGWNAVRRAPSWARAAAAVLVLGASAGMAGAIANLDVRYDHGALTLRTGWSRTTTADAASNRDAAARPSVSPAVASGPAPWQADLDAFERRLQAELRATREATPATRTETTPSADAQLLKRARAIVEESERRQRNELALRIAEVVQEFDAKRATDLASLRNMKTIQSATGIEVARQQQWLNLLTQASVQSR